jgi:hypothetical protein
LSINQTIKSDYFVYSLTKVFVKTNLDTFTLAGQGFLYSKVTITNPKTIINQASQLQEEDGTPFQKSPNAFG